MATDGGDRTESFFAALLSARPATLGEVVEHGLTGWTGSLWVLEDGEIIDGEELVQRGAKRLGPAGRGDFGVQSRWDLVVRFRAYTEGRSPNDVARDPAFLDDWQAVLEASQFPVGERRAASADAWDEMGVIEPRGDGSWRYSDEYLTWLLTQYLGREAS